MTRHILLDSSPLSALSRPPRGSEVLAIRHWMRACLAAGHEVYVPEVIDYELRRELIRAGRTSSIDQLNALKSTLNYLPITTDAMLRAAELWAESRNRGLSTGEPLKLDVDVILAAQALTLDVPASDVVIATSNVRHLASFVAAELWTDITP